MNNIISLHGSYFGNNYGDILLVRIFAKWIKDSFGDNVSLNLPLANVKITRELPICTTGLKKLLKSKALIYCGGGYFGEQSVNPNKWAFRNFFRHVVIGILAIIFRIPIAIIGVEFGPISSKWFRKTVIFLARNADVIVVRNKESLEFLENYNIKNVKCSVDAVLSLSDFVSPVVSDSKKKIILLHIPGIKRFPDKFVILVKQIIKQAKETFGANYRILLIHDDYQAIYSTVDYKVILDLLKDVDYSIMPYSSIHNFINMINSSSFVFTTKLHVGITAAALNKNVFSVYIHSKVPRLHKQIGNSVFCIPITCISEDTGILIKDFFLKKNFKLNDSIKDVALVNKVETIRFVTNCINM